jgi:Zn-finger nucleic acid-binding protein
MKCLNCGKEMVNYEVHKIGSKLSYDLCESCGGLWLDRGGLDKMAFQVQGDIEFCSEEEIGKILEPVKKCPRCNGMPLHKVKFLGYSDILLDHCKNCGGFWLDGGELQQIDDYLAKIMPVKKTGFSDVLAHTHLPFIKRDSKETDFSVPVLPVKHATPLGSTKHPCPACKNYLDLFGVYGIQIESCSKCNGLWLERGELKVLKDKVDTQDWGNLRWMNDEIDAIEKSRTILSKRLCPQCPDSKLLSTHFGNSETIVDWCGQCHGVWLDRDGFETIVQYLNEELSHMTSKEMEKKVAQEVEKIWSKPGSKFSEILDAKAAISALINIDIYEHPHFAKFLFGIESAAHSVNLG